MARTNAVRGKSPRPSNENRPVTPTPSAASGNGANAVSRTKVKNKKNLSYQSDGVEDHDVFLLPVSDYLVALAVTVLATVVRVFRIYQPSSVVFDEVQLVPIYQPVVPSND